MPVVDFATQIRTQITAEVQRLKLALQSSHLFKPEFGDYNVTLGNLVNLHHGHPVFRAGELVDDAPFKVDTTDLWIVEVTFRDRKPIPACYTAATHW